MAEYLSKEEILKWRRSLERITLEEYAARLGKVIQEEKHNDTLVDTVMIRSLNSMTTEKYIPTTEKIKSFASHFTVILTLPELPINDEAKLLPPVE